MLQDTKEEIRSRKSKKNRQYHDRQNPTQKKMKLSNSNPTSDIRRVTAKRHGNCVVCKSSWIAIYKSNINKT
jgi:hypothetical protein